MECSICFENVTKETGKAELSCSHTFHLKCLSQWFMKNENCPCCRHEANETEKMVPMNNQKDDDTEYDDDEIDSDYDDDDDEDEREPSEIEESRNRAQQLFRLKRMDLKKDDFEAYAATRISALVRGYQSRMFFFELKCWKEDEKNALEEAENAKIVLKKAKSAQNFYKKIASMKRTQWKAFAATMIQAKWRSKKQLENYKKEKLARNMEVGFKVTIEC